MGPKEKKKALLEIRKFLAAKAQEQAHDEIREYLETHADEIGPLLGCAGDHVREVVAEEHAKALQNIATLELYRGFLQTCPAAEVPDYVRSHVPSLMAAFGVSDPKTLKAAFGVSDPKTLKLFEHPDHALLVIPKRIERLRGNLTHKFLATLKEASSELAKDAVDEDLRRAQSAADQIHGKLVDFVGTPRWELALSDVVACTLGSKDDDVTCFESAFGKVHVAAWRIKAAARAVGKRPGLRVYFVDRDRRNGGRPGLVFLWPAAEGRSGPGYLDLRGPAPNRGARVVTVSLREVKS